MNHKLETIVLIGAGNLAVNLGKALYRKGYRILQVYSRTEEAAASLAGMVSSGFTTSLEAVTDEADLYIVSLTDATFESLLPTIVSGKQDKFFVHTAGSIPLDVWKGYVKRYGVFYPMQTFSKAREVNFEQIPIFLEANEEAGLEQLKVIAGDLFGSVHVIDSVQRRSLHLSAVFACNFTNHMYVLAAELLEKHNLPFEVMLPLIDETARKVHELSPRQAQTGPAVRYDENVINRHLELLKDEPQMRELYEKLSKSIYNK